LATELDRGALFSSLLVLVISQYFYPPGHLARQCANHMKPLMSHQ
jgi:hypothetical protein